MTTLSHGHARDGAISKTYGVWKSMRHRCRNKNDPNYHHYGGRGITVCERWNSFENFLADMGEKPDGLTLEREDNDRGYGPDNCRWASWSDQHRNTRHNRMLTMGGRTQCLKAWAQETGVSPVTISSRIKLYGWSVEEALTLPVGTKGQRRRIA